MSLSYASRRSFEDAERRLVVVTVQSKYCFYNVAISDSSVVIAGPGVEEEMDREELPADLSSEGLALIAVIQFEEGR